MATMNISLPDKMREWVDRQTESGRYGNASDYMRDLIRRDEERQAKIARMQKLIDEGRESGISEQSFDEIIADARKMIGGDAV